MDVITSELISSGVEGTVKALTALCQKIWEKMKWPKEWTKSLVIPLPKKGSLRQCHNYRTISLASHPSSGGRFGQDGVQLNRSSTAES